MATAGFTYAGIFSAVWRSLGNRSLKINRVLYIGDRIRSNRWLTSNIGQTEGVVFGAHVVLYSSDAEADRHFLAETFGMESVDAGNGWLIFALPPTEVAVHPADAAGAELFLMCEDLEAQVESLEARGVRCSRVEQARWGSITKITLPGGGELGLYQPRHPLAIAHPL
jgi:hypothetical protein